MRPEIVKVKFLKTIILPRFTIFKDETWEVRKEKIKGDGFNIGGGFIEAEFYKEDKDCNLESEVEAL